MNEQEKLEYANYISEKYSAARITEISKNICEIIEANILGVSSQDYDPVGASSMILMSDIKGGGAQWCSPQVKMHLDKSHITTHTYPDILDPDGICSFRVDIDIATCGEIIPLNAMNYLFEAFECDVVYVDYVVRGYTRLEDGKKIYNDHHFGSIRDYIKPEILKQFTFSSDINMPQSNIWQTKLMIQDMPASRYLLKPTDDKNLVEAKMKLLTKEMHEVYHMIN